MRAAVLALALLLAGCTTGAVYLKHPRTGEVGKCGSHFEPNPLFPGFSECCGALRRLNRCIAEFREQGYERLSDGYEPKNARPE